MAKNPSLSVDEADLFRRQVGSVKRLRHDRIEPRVSSTAPTPQQTRNDERQVMADMLDNYFEPAELDTGEELYYCRAGIQHAVLRKLRRGQFRVARELDLHGLNADGAHTVLSQFLSQAKRDGIACVRIIHGKGKRSRHKGPVLKNKVNHWLRRRDDVLAFCSARPTDGGTGAVYVLLSR